jgi:hypothetical protein
VKSLIIKLVLLLSLSAQASYFEQHGANSDPQCSYWNMDRFSKVTNWFTAGVAGSKKYGFDYEIPITRRGVDVIWCAVAQASSGHYNKICTGLLSEGTRPFSKYSKYPSSQNLLVKFKNLEDQYSQYYLYVMDTIYKDRIHGVNVGYILEVLVRYFFMDLTNTIDKRNFNITGGVEYAQSANSSTLGELDIIVYHRKTCRVIGVGESKASSPKSSSRALSKAKSQIRRFYNFIK